MSSLAELYHKHAPRWVKVIRWREWGNRVVANQKSLVFTLLIPAIGTFYVIDNIPAHMIAILKPKNEEELSTIKQNWSSNIYQRNWEMGQYETEMPPLYDMAQRRKKYPQYYGDRYNGFERTEYFGRMPKQPNHTKELVRD